MKHFFYLLLLQVVSVFCFSQSLLPVGKTANWKDIGALDIPVLTDSVQININDYGGDPNGSIDNSEALTSAITFLKATGKIGIVFFGAGTYLFNKTIHLTDNLILKGIGATTTRLQFIMGGKDDLIVVSGSLDPLTTTTVIGDGVMNQYKLRVTNPAAFNVGDMVKLKETDADLVYSDWADESVGQIMQIKSIVGDSMEFYSTMRIRYPASRSPYLIKANTVKNVGISCMDIVRGDNVTNGGQYSNIVLNVTSNCWLNGVQSDYTYYAHVAISNSYHDVIKNSYFTNSYDYGGDGRGYGIACQFSSSENLIVNNIFRMLRHAMLLQAGANGNVFAYNYSRETYWVQSMFPSDVSGDIVFHGNYNFGNLFEGNIVQNLELDNSHGINGPYNLFFRNRAENVGIFMNSGAGDSSAFIGNEITTTDAKAAVTIFGQHPYALYTLTGNGNFEYGNNFRGANKPANTSVVDENSYYLTAKPSFFTDNWPSIGYPNTLNSGTIPAKARYDAGNYTVCTLSNNTVLAQAVIVLSGRFASPIDHLSWSASATNKETIYKIMMSIDGVHFDSVGQQVALATSVQTIYYFSYSLINPLRNATTIYFKVIAYQKGEITVTSNVYALKNDFDNTLDLVVTIFPNPTNSQASAIFYAEKDKVFSAKIIDQQGKQLLSTQIKTVNGWNNIKFSFASFAAGIYYLSTKLNEIEKTYLILKQ